MDGTGYNYGYGYRKKNSMATASLVLGIISIICVVTVQFIYFGVVLGCLGMIFALLSKGGGYSMSGRAVGGFATSALAVIMTVAIVAFAVWFAVSVFGLETVLDPEALSEALEAFYGQYSELLESMTGGVSL